MSLRPGLSGLRARWKNLDTFTRRRIGVVGLGSLIAAIAVALALVSDRSARPGGAARLVPADALAYVQVDTDPAASEVHGATAFAKGLPMLSGQVVTRLESPLDAIAAAGLSPGGNRPGWVGDQAAVAWLGGTYPPATVQFIAVANQKGADAFARRLTGDQTGTPYRGMTLRTGRRGTAAITANFLVFGPLREVKLVIDTAIGDSDSLSGAGDFDAATGALPGGSLAEAYLSPAGITALAGPGSSLSFLGPLARGSAVTNLALSLTASSSSLELTARTSLGSGHAGRPSLADLRTFEATLPQRLAADSLAYVGVGPGGRAAPQALAGLGGLGSAVRTAFVALVPGQSASALRRLVPAFGHETALVVQNGPKQRGSVLVPPALGLVSTGVDPNVAKAALASKRAKRLAGLVSGKTLQVGSDAPELKNLTNPHGSLDTTAGFSNALAGFSTEPSLEAYLDLESLVPLFEAAGLAENPAYASFAPEVRRLRGLGVAVTSDTTSITAQVRLTVSGNRTGAPANGPD